MPLGRIESFDEGAKLKVSFQYNPEFVVKAKTVPGYKYNPIARAWIYPKKALRLLREAFPDFELEPGLSPVQSISIPKPQIISWDVSKPLPDGRVLREAQKEGVRLIKEVGSCILGFDVGVGKTLAALLGAEVFSIPVIVIVKPSLVVQWQREIEHLGVQGAVFTWTKMPKSSDLPQNFVAIFDESQLYKNIKAQRTKEMLRLSGKAVAVIHLTGTPMFNGRPKELYSLLLSIDHEVAINQRFFERRYCGGHTEEIWAGKLHGHRRIWVAEGCTNWDELREKISDRVLIRRKRDCLDLPPFQRIMRPVELSMEARQVYDRTFTLAKVLYNQRREEAVASFLQRLQEQEIPLTEAERNDYIEEVRCAGQQIAEIQMIRRAASIAKVESALELAEEILQSGNNPLIFTAFQESGEAIAKELKLDFLCGETPVKLRQPMVDRVTSGEKPGLVSTIRAGGEGLNLQACNYCIMVDREWAPGASNQAEGRIDRQGQQRDMTSIWLQLPGLDEHIDDALLEKQEVIEKVLGGERKTMRGTKSAYQLQKEIAKEIFR